MLQINAFERAKLTLHVPELAIVVPTFNERDNVIPLLEKIDTALQGVPREPYSWTTIPRMVPRKPS